MLFFALSALYYYKERQRLYQEKKIESRMSFAECKRLHKLLKSTTPCTMRVVELRYETLKPIYSDIGYAFLVALLLILPFAFFLAKLSLRPMRESVMAMDSFINGIVHDINTPLSVIRMSAQSIKKHLHEEKLQVKLSRLLQGIEQVESLEEQLLFNVKIGQYTLQKEYFDLGKILLDREVYYSSLRSSIALHVKASSYEVYADKVALLRMVDNIVLNAIKYSPAKRSVYISLNEDILEIKDEGIGIKHPKKIFTKYYREALESKGIGLGLYIVQHIAFLHNLKINVHSVVDEGSCFSINIKPISKTTLKIH